MQAKGHIPGSTSSEKRLYEWLDRNLLRLHRLPRELVKQLYDSHPLVAAKVRAAQAKQVQRGLPQKEQSGAGKVPFFQGCCGHLGDVCGWTNERCAICGRTISPTPGTRCGGKGDIPLNHSSVQQFPMPPVVGETRLTNHV